MQLYSNREEQEAATQRKAQGECGCGGTGCGNPTPASPEPPTTSEDRSTEG